MLPCAKSISGVGAFIVLAVGVIMTCITIYGYTNSAIFLDDTASRNSVLMVMIIADILILIAAGLGILGIKKQKAIFIFVFQIFVIIFMIVFFSLGIATEVLPGQYFDGNCTTATNKNVQLASAVAVFSELTFCRKSCACSLTNDTINTKYSPIQRPLITQILINRTNGVKSTRQCDVFKILNDDQKRMAVILGELQDSLECSGWCNLGSNNPLGWIYRFSDVSNGKPDGYCYDILMNKVNTYSNIIGLSSFFTSLFLLLVALVNVYLCFHPERKQLSLKQRFSYTPQGKYRRLV